MRKFVHKLRYSMFQCGRQYKGNLYLFGKWYIVIAKA